MSRPGRNPRSCWLLTWATARLPGCQHACYQQSWHTKIIYTSSGQLAVLFAESGLRSATHAYVMFHVPNDQEESVKLTVEEACRVGHRHGVGVIVMGDRAGFDTWEEREEAHRVEPDPQRLDEFIAAQLSQAAHDRIARALH